MSLIEEVRAAQQRARETAHRDLAVPGYGGKIIVRYQPTARGALDDVVTAAMAGQALSEDEEQQLLIDCCQQVLHASGPGEPAEPVDPDGEPLRFDAGDTRWQTLVGLRDCKTARDVVAALFMLDEQPLAASGHAQTLIGFLQGFDRELEARAEGELDAAASS